MTTMPEGGIKRVNKWWVIGAVAAFLLVLFGFGIYRWSWHGGVVRMVTTVLPYPAAIVDGAVIRYGDFEENVLILERFYEEERKRVPAGSIIPDAATIRSRVLDRMIRDRLAENLAAREGVSVGSSDVRKAYDASILDQAGRESDAGRARAELRAEDTLSSLYGLTPSQFKDRMLRPFLVRQKLQDIIRKDETLNAEKIKKAEAALAELRAGKDFKSVALAYSEDPTVASTGGDRGFIGRGLLAPEVEAAAFEMKPGELKGPIVSQYGFHVLKVEERRLAVDKTVEKIRLFEILVKPIQIDDYLDAQLKNASVITFVH